MSSNVTVDNNDLAEYVVETIDQGAGVHRQVMQVFSSEKLPIHDSIELTYVAAGDGAGEIETVTYKLEGVTKRVTTITYDASDRVSSVSWVDS